MVHMLLLSAGVGIVELFALWGLLYHLGGTVKSVLALSF
jgi:hypothetical protein